MYFTETPPAAGLRAGLFNRQSSFPDIEEDEPLQEAVAQLLESVGYRDTQNLY